MKYWTLFILRMMARAGLALAVILWVMGQRHEFWEVNRWRGCEFSIGALSREAGAVFRLTSAPQIEVLDLEFPGIHLLIKAPGFWAVSVDHWLLCLFFFIATVATGWPRKTKEQRTVEAAATEGDA